MIIDRNNIFDVINKSNCKPDKDYGQNFLIEPLVSEKIVNLLDINNIDESVLEIGPGIGSLTHFISSKTNNLTIVDIDRRMCDFLQVVYPDTKLVCNDIRKVEVNEYQKIIANLPYNVTTEIITYLLTNALSAKKIVLMCQSETFNHFYDISGSEYGPVSIFIHLIGKIKREFNVKAGCFMPQPKCTSTVFTIDIDSSKDRKLAFDCFMFSKKLFLNRRKTILNNFINMGVEKANATEILESLNISVLSRPEEISPEKYLELYKKYQEK